MGITIRSLLPDESYQPNSLSAKWVSKISGTLIPVNTDPDLALAVPAPTNTVSSESTAWTSAVSASASTPLISDSRSWTKLIAWIAENMLFYKEDVNVTSMKYMWLE